MDKKWDCLDYILLGLPMIVTTWAIWYNPGEGSVNSLNTEFIVAIIAGGIALLGILLKHYLYDRKQYKDILKRLGDFEHMSLEARIGDTVKAGDLTSQNEHIHYIIGNTQSKGDLTSQHDIIQQKLDLIGKTVIHEKQHRKAKENLLAQNTPDGKAALLMVETIVAQLNAAQQRIHALEAENLRLRRMVNTNEKDSGNQEAENQEL